MEPVFHVIRVDRFLHIWYAVLQVIQIGTGVTMEIINCTCPAVLQEKVCHNSKIRESIVDLALKGRHQFIHPQAVQLDPLLKNTGIGVTHTGFNVNVF